MARLSKETIEHMEEMLSRKVTQTNDKGLLDISRLVKGRYVTTDLQVNYLMDSWELLEKCIEINDASKMQRYLIRQRNKINGLFSKNTL